ncbi:hypothetical protein [Micromonospora sediminicola]|uniref:hypothetical protein n=1 Tax=Micromonospora sediminicola TaxID=946078 RepID=UPI0037A8B84C
MTDTNNIPAVAEDRISAGDRWLEEAIDAFADGAMPRAAAAGQIAAAYFTSAEAVSRRDPVALLRSVENAQRIVGVGKVPASFGDGRPEAGR